MFLLNGRGLTFLEAQRLEGPGGLTALEARRPNGLSSPAVLTASTIRKSRQNRRSQQSQGNRRPKKGPAVSGGPGVTSSKLFDFHRGQAEGVSINLSLTCLVV